MGVGRITTEENGKVESNDSPEIPDGGEGVCEGETSDIPGLPSWVGLIISFVR